MGDAHAGNVVLAVITEFTSEFRTMIDGNTNDLAVNELSGGARISFVYHELYNNGVKSIDPFDQVKDGDIRTILYNSSVRMNSKDCDHHVLLTAYAGIDSFAFRWNHRIRSDCQATNKETGRS